MTTNFIVTTTIYSVSKALKQFKDWTLVIVGDQKTPHEEYETFENENSNVKYLSPEYQDNNFTDISNLLGWNTISRRNIGFLYALQQGADIIASVDDDNIPLDNWCDDIRIGKLTNVYYYETDEIAFDPIGVTNYKHLWHRGYPIQLLHGRNDKYHMTRKEVIPDIQAMFWNGDPDIDAVCRLEHKPMCFFEDSYFPLGTNTFSPFNSQNTIFSRNALKKYMAFPFIGRMDDIWGGYYLESLGYNVIYTKATVFQDRNVQNLTKNLTDEYIGYQHTLSLLQDIKTDPQKVFDYLPEKTKDIYKMYLNRQGN